MLGLLVSERVNAVLLQAQDERLRIGQEQGRMRGNDKLGAVDGELMEPGEQGQLPGRRQRRLRLVEEVEPATAEASSAGTGSGVRDAARLPRYSASRSRSTIGRYPYWRWSTSGGGSRTSDS